MLTELDWINSTLFNSFIEPIQIYRNGEKWIFIDGKIQDILNEMLSIYSQFDSHSLDYTSIPCSHREIKVQVLGEIVVSRCSVCQNPKLNRTQYENIIRKFFEKYEEFKEFIGTMRLSTDTIV